MAEDSADLSSLDAIRQFPVGKRLQAVRRMRGLSQRELARRAGITNGSLSLIEQGRVSPSLSSLEKILQAVSLTLVEFFAGATPAPVIQKAAGWARVEDGPARVRLMQLSADPGTPRYLMEYELAGGAKQAVPLPAGSCSFVAGVVLQGVLELRLDGMRQRAEAGDGFQFTCQREQQFFNPADSDCRFILFGQGPA